MQTEPSSDIVTEPENRRLPDKTARASLNTLKHNLISISAILLLISFFMPWVIILGVPFSGLAVQKNFTSYSLIWLMPLMGLVTFLLNMANSPIGLIRRISGLGPYVIIMYSIAKFGFDILPEIKYGGWLAFVSGGALLLLPAESHEESKPA